MANYGDYYGNKIQKQVRVCFGNGLILVMLQLNI